MSTIAIPDDMTIADDTMIRASYATAADIHIGARIYAFGQFVAIDNKVEDATGAVTVALANDHILTMSRDAVLSYI